MSGVVRFDPPFKGQDTDSHFHVAVWAVDMAHPIAPMALVMDEDGFLEVKPLNRVQTDWRWDAQKNTFVSIDDPEPGPDDE